MNLPVEVIQHIFYFLGPCEIVRLRQVSRQFHDITRSSSFWRRIYANARLLLPPGPFPSQSARYLERTLVQSELVSKTWVSQPLETRQHSEISWQHLGIGGQRTVFFGRWCMFLQGKTIQCHDIDTDTRHFLYDGTAHPRFWFSACTATYGNVQWVYLLLTGQETNESIRLLEFRVDGDNFSGPDIIDWPQDHITLHPSDVYGKPPVNFYGSVPFIAISKCLPCIVFDLHTRRLYRLPASELTTHSTSIQPLQLVLTKTHVIAIQTHVLSSDVSVVIEAFVVPDTAIHCGRNMVGELRLTHKGTICTSSCPVHLLRNSVVDPVTGSTNIRLLHFGTSGDEDWQTHVSCLDLDLPEPVSTDIAPLFVRSQIVFKSIWTYACHTASDKGYVRGMLMVRSEDPSAENVRKFTIDASEGECFMVVSDPASLHPLPAHPFDGMRGRAHRFWAAQLNRVVTLDLV